MFVCLFFKEKLGVSRLNKTTKIPGAGSQIASVLWSADKHFCVWARASIVIQMHIKCGDTEASLCFSQQNPPPPPQDASALLCNPLRLFYSHQSGKCLWLSYVPFIAGFGLISVSPRGGGGVFYIVSLVRRTFFLYCASRRNSVWTRFSVSRGEINTLTFQCRGRSRPPVCR